MKVAGTSKMGKMRLLVVVIAATWQLAAAASSSSPTLQLLQPNKRPPTTTTTTTTTTTSATPTTSSPVVAATSNRQQEGNNTSATPTTTITTTTNSAATVERPSPSTWIETILIQVDGLRGDEGRGGGGGEEDGDENSSSQPSSLAPTDSGEDPLEMTSTDLSLNLNTDTDEHERRLVESNNVSLLAAASTTTVASVSATPLRGHNNNNNNNNLQELGQQQPPPPRQLLSCDQARNQCALRKACAPALKAYNDDCRELVNNRTSQCSPRCLRALIGLRSSEEGDDLLHCDCEGNQYCESSKQRSQACRPQVELAVDPKTEVACSTASWICMADQLCSTAFEYYYRNCQSLFSHQRHCNLHCNNSLAILYRQPKAKKLINCHCDGSEDFPCVKYKTLTERLCLGQSPQLNNNIHDNDDVAGEAEQQLDSPLNMSNDPFGGGNDDEGDNISNNDEDFQDEDVDSSSSSSSSPMPKDNWLPLMSGSYFTNLHHQEQQQLQQQQQAQKHGNKQKSKSTSNNRPHETPTGRRRRLLVLESSASPTNSLPLMSFVSTTTWLVALFVGVFVATGVLYRLCSR